MLVMTPARLLSLPMWWATNQMSDTEMVCPSGLILPGQQAGVGTPEVL